MRSTRYTREHLQSEVDRLLAAWKARGISVPDSVRVYTIGLSHDRAIGVLSGYSAQFQSVLALSEDGQRLTMYLKVDLPAFAQDPVSTAGQLLYRYMTAPLALKPGHSFRSPRDRANEAWRRELFRAPRPVDDPWQTEGGRVTLGDRLRARQALRRRSLARRADSVNRTQ